MCCKVGTPSKACVLSCVTNASDVAPRISESLVDINVKYYVAENCVGFRSVVHSYDSSCGLGTPSIVLSSANIIVRLSLSPCWGQVLYLNLLKRETYDRCAKDDLLNLCKQLSGAKCLVFRAFV